MEDGQTGRQSVGVHKHNQSSIMVEPGDGGVGDTRSSSLTFGDEEIEREDDENDASGLPSRRRNRTEKCLEDR